MTFMDPRPPDPGKARRRGTPGREAGISGNPLPHYASMAPVQSAGAAYQKDIAHYIRMRQFRHQVLPGQWFADPAWDILLDLFLAEAKGKPAFLTSIAAAVPITTVLRWVVRLETAGLLVRRADPWDRRRTLLTLTAPSRDGISLWAQKMFGHSAIDPSRK